MFCIKCGTKLDEDTNFCPKCGKSTANKTRLKSKPIKKRTSNKTKVVVIPLALIIIISSVFFYNMFISSQPVNIVKKFVSALNDKDINKIVTCIDPKQEKVYKATSSILKTFIKVDLQDIADLVPAFYDYSKAYGNYADLHIEILDIVSSSTSGSKSTVVLNVKITSIDQDNRKTTETGESIFYLKKFDEGWRIVDFR